MQCQSLHCGSRSSSLSSGVLPHIIWRWDPAWRSQVSWSPPDATLRSFGYPLPRYCCILSMMSIISLDLASFFIRTSSTTTSDFLDICALYVWVMCCGMAFESGDRPCMYLVRIRLTRTTRFFFTAFTSDRVGKKDSVGKDDNFATCPTRERPMPGMRLRPTSRLYIWSIVAWLPDRTSRTFLFLSTLSPQNLKMTSSLIHCCKGTVWIWLTSPTSFSVAV